MEIATIMALLLGPIVAVAVGLVGAVGEYEPQTVEIHVSSGSLSSAGQQPIPTGSPPAGSP